MTAQLFAESVDAVNMSAPEVSSYKDSETLKESTPACVTTRKTRHLLDETG